MRRVESGNADAFEELYHRFSGRAYRVAWAVCRDDGRAEEAVQEAFASIWRNTAPFDASRGELSAWLLSLVRYRAIDVARDDGRHARNRADEEKIDRHSAPAVMADDVLAREGASQLNALLGRLPDAQAEVITLAFYGQLSHSEIAAQLKLPPGTVKGRMRLGLQRLRTDLDQVGASARWHVALTGAFYDGDMKRAGRIVADASSELPPASVLDDVLAPAMHSVGALWQSDVITPAHEQLATTICHRLLAEIGEALAIAPARSRETVMLVTPAPEQHTLGLLMADEVLYGAGYDTVRLFGGTSEAELRSALLRHQPAVVALSMTMRLPDSFTATSETIREVLPKAQLIVGGATAQSVSSDGPHHYVERLDGLLSKVDELLAPQRV
jgi:RNA polymerase sigma-70 factor (ECF subfamily)